MKLKKSVLLRSVHDNVFGHKTNKGDRKFFFCEVVYILLSELGRN